MKLLRVNFSNFLPAGIVLVILLFGLSCVTPAGGKGTVDPGKTEPGKTEPGKTDPGKTDPGKTDPPKPVTFHPGGIVIPGEQPGADGPRKPGGVGEPGQGPWSEYRFIKSRRGLNMRALPAVGGRKLLVIPYNARVLVMHSQKKTVSLGGKTGRWARIQFGDTFGWVFDAYLAPVRGPDILDAAALRAMFRDTAFRARLYSDDPGVGRVIGRLRKKAGREAPLVDTLRRTCGRGKLDGGPEFQDESLRFYVKYRWCKVDPGNEVRVTCVNCDMYRYECTVPGKALNGHIRAGGGAFEKKITCKLVAKTLCPRNCPL